MTQWDGFPTPESLPDTVTMRLLAIPNDPQYIAAVGGALHRLTNPDEWKSVGAISPDDAAYRALLMMRDYWERTMIGVVVPYASKNPPPYTLPCDGKLYNRVDYPLLYAAIDPFFRQNADQFRVPQLIGRVVVGAEIVPDEEIYYPGAAGGEMQHQLTVAEMPSHSHTDAGHTHTEIIAAPNVTTIGPGVPEPTAVPSPGVTGVSFANIQPTGQGTPHNNMQPYLSLKYAIFYA